MKFTNTLKKIILTTLIISQNLINTQNNNKNNNNNDTVEDFIKVRCSLTGESQIYSFNGSVFHYLPQQQPELLFKILGFNIARCIKKDNDWVLLTRELMYYLDPITGEKLSEWKNPYTNETVNVVHVSNDPVNNYMGAVPIERISSQLGLYIIDVPLFYPNPLHDDKKFKDFTGKDKYYEAGEFFKFYFNLEELKQSENKLSNVSIAWNRDSPYLPWMKMKDINGRLVISAYGAKADNFEAFPLWLKMELKLRLNKYLHAPKEYVEPNETSFTYFKKYFDEYMNFEQFPLQNNEEENAKNENLRFME